MTKISRTFLSSTMPTNKEVLLFICLICVFTININFILVTTSRDSKKYVLETSLSSNRHRRENSLFDAKFGNNIPVIKSTLSNDRATESVRVLQKSTATIKDVKTRLNSGMRDPLSDRKIRGYNHSDMDVSVGHRAGGNNRKSHDTSSVEEYDFPPFVSWSPEDGVGENNRPAFMDPKNLSAHDRMLYNKGYARNSFNQFISDRISVTRRLPDIRSPNCKSQIFSDLPEVSVIVVFRNEAWSVLLRSVHSILNRAPPNLVKEVILVDDYSDYDFLKKPLDRYVKMLDKVRILHTDKREGLIRCRLMGFKVARAPVLVFLDSHIECFPGWLEPLLERIQQNPTTATVPLIQTIDTKHFQISTYRNKITGTFNWNALTFKWKSISSNFKDVLKSPTMPGGLFAIDKNYFTKLGAYDPGLDIWGSENMELSFKVWMCNGSIEIVLCSHVGHVFRAHNPNKWPQTGTGSRLPVDIANAFRVADVWMDEYKEYVFERVQRKGHYGDVSERKKLRDSLHCKSFDWYMKNVHPDKYIPKDVIYSGEIRSAAIGKQNYCLDSMLLRLHPCHGMGGGQFWYMTDEGQIHQEYSVFLCVVNGVVRKLSGNCRRLGSELVWRYRENGSLFHYETEMCLKANRDRTVTLATCSNSYLQKWIIKRRKHTNSITERNF